MSWVNSLVKIKEGQIVAIDGKTLRRSYDRGAEKSALHMINAWSLENHMVLGQYKSEGKSNEIKSIPKLLYLLNIEGAIVTIDAMGTQKAIAKKIIEKKADYVLALKGNQKNLYEDVKLFLDTTIEKSLDEIPHDTIEITNKGHGRVERRRYWITEKIEWLDSKPEWSGLKSIGVVEAERFIKGKKSIERRYYICSIAADAKQFSHAVRGHWAVENSLHWCLDMAFREDESRVRKDDAAENFGTIRQIALNLLKQEKSSKMGIANKRLKSGWDHSYLAKVLEIGQI
jgi:predicted transposase YbfD/YdcC